MPRAYSLPANELLVLNWLLTYKSVIIAAGGSMWLHYLMVRLLYRCVLLQISAFGKKRQFKATLCWKEGLKNGLLHDVVFSKQARWLSLVEQISQVSYRSAGSKREATKV